MFSSRCLQRRENLLLSEPESPRILVNSEESHFERFKRAHIES